MYEKPLIIREAVSNNRLNYEERENKTLVVPSLIEGTLDDVMIGEDIVIEGEVNGTITAGKGLKHFVFLKNSKVPTWIMDNHNHAFAFWHEAYWKGWIKKGSLLVHIDQHTDLATPTDFPQWKSPEEANEKIVEHCTNTDLTIADFIVPALATGLLSEAVMVTGEDRNGAGVFIWKDNALHKNGNSKLETQNSVIVDIDLDYFSQGFDEAKTLETTRYWVEKADIITIATSPLFIDQGKALGVLKSLHLPLK